MKSYDKLTLSISLFSLILSMYVAYAQFRPVKDSVLMEGYLFFSELEPLKEVYKGSRISKFYGIDKALGGPFILELTLSNTLSRSVAIKYLSVEYSFSKPIPFRHSLVEKEDYEKSKKIIKIEGNSVERITLNINLPFYMTSEKRKCLDEQKDNADTNNPYKKCYYDKGQDIFGNEIRYIKSLNDGKEMMLIAPERDMPKVKIKIKTGDDTTFEKIVTLNGIFPFYVNSSKTGD
ncbi:hypothetical protein R0K18_08450 [Pantoea sp. SIMBA_133]|uniref:hypothetical protein n=1 Tax=Pantoea ananas TaxID=553 RepID=UPI001B305D7B|nr:hypothetical protein [Pantoea ananatis]